MGREPMWRRYARLHRADPAADVDDELSFHLEERIREYVARGMDPETARETAIARFGNVSGVRRECAQMLAEEQRAAQRRDWLGDLRQDLRFGVRAWLRTPLFSALAVITLALGIGANAAIFGVVKSVLLDALPYREPEGLVRVYGYFLDGTEDRGALSAGSVDAIRTRHRSFERVAAFMGYAPDVVVGGEVDPQVRKVAWVEPGLFQTLGVSPALGRTFVDEDVVGDTARVVVLTHGMWQQLFAGDSGVLGRLISVNGIARQIIGVLPRGFVGPVDDVDLYFGLNIEPTLRNPISARRSHWLGLVGRLKPGVAPEAAHREVAAIGAALAREYPEDLGTFGIRSTPLRDAMVGDTRTPLIILMAGAGLVLLITCANLAGALLSRTISRRKEFAVRVALGAGRGRLVRQLLTESTMLAVAGGLAGLVLATLILGGLRGLALEALPEYAELSLDRGAVLITAAVALLTGIAFGVAPALSAGRWDPQGPLRDETRGTSESRRSGQLRGALVAGQIALSVTLLAGAGLLARSLWAMTATPIGFDPEGVVAVAVQLPAGSYGAPEDLRQFHDAFLTRLRSLPGVESAAHAGMLPTRVQSRMGLAIVGEPPPPNDQTPFVLYASVSDDYFRTLRIPLLRGRTFGPEDRPDGPPAIVISETMAHRFWPRGDALGARIRLGPNPNSTPLEVIGIVGDVRNDLARTDAEPMAYASSRQNPWSTASYLIRTAGAPLGIVPAVRRELQAIDRGLPLEQPMTLRAVIAEGLSMRRLPVLLMTGFGVLALLLASVGVYALFSSMAAAREREFGVRIALGSSPRAIAALVLRQGALWMALGLAGSVVGVVLVARIVRDFLYGVSPFDPLTLGVAVLALLACAIVALLVPLRRATRVDPITVLR